MVYSVRCITVQVILCLQCGVDKLNCTSICDAWVWATTHPIAWNICFMNHHALMVYARKQLSSLMHTKLLAQCVLTHRANCAVAHTILDSARWLFSGYCYLMTLVRDSISGKNTHPARKIPDFNNENIKPCPKPSMCWVPVF